MNMNNYYKCIIFILGLSLAILGYTVVRVILNHGLNNFKIVKKLTEKI